MRKREVRGHQVTSRRFDAGVIGGIVSYLIAYVVTRVLDYLSSKTNGAFGWHKPHEDVDGPEARTTTFRIKGPDTSAASGSDDSVYSDTQADKVCGARPHLASGQR